MYNKSCTVSTVFLPSPASSSITHLSSWFLSHLCHDWALAHGGERTGPQTSAAPSAATAPSSSHRHQLHALFEKITQSKNYTYTMRTVGSLKKTCAVLYIHYIVRYITITVCPFVHKEAIWRLLKMANCTLFLACASRHARISHSTTTLQPSRS